MPANDGYTSAVHLVKPRAAGVVGDQHDDGRVTIAGGKAAPPAELAFER